MYVFGVWLTYLLSRHGLCEHNTPWCAFTMKSGDIGSGANAMNVSVSHQRYFKLLSILLAFWMLFLKRNRSAKSQGGERGQGEDDVVTEEAHIHP